MDAVAFVFGLVVAVIIMALSYGVGYEVGKRNLKDIPTAELIDDDDDADWWKKS